MKRLLLLILSAIFLTNCVSTTEPTQASVIADDMIVQDAEPVSDTAVSVVIQDSIQEDTAVDEAVVENSAEENNAADGELIQDSTIQPENPADDATVILGGDEEALREFMVRWFTPLYPPESPDPVVVSIGRLQEELPIELPMPDDARLIASITGQWADYTLVLDTGLSPDEVQGFYAQELLDRGWQLPATGMETGFVPQPVFNSYCFNDGNTSLSVGASSIAEGVTDLRLDLHIDADPHMCQGGEMGHVPDHLNLIPLLEAPDGAVTSGSGSSAGGTDAEVSTQLKTNLTAAELATHYNHQLESAGWEAVTQSDGDGAAWSTWSLADEQGETWSGTLFVIESAVAGNGRYASLRIERNP